MLPGKLAACVAEAERRKAPVRVSRVRGYESLVAHTGLVAPEGSRQMVETNLEMLAALRAGRPTQVHL